MSAATRRLAQSDERGALPQLYATTMPDVAPGDYFGPDGLFELWGHPQRTESSRASRDQASAARLWDVSSELTGVTYQWNATRAGTTP
jgi:hypothetical protein